MKLLKIELRVEIADAVQNHERVAAGISEVAVAAIKQEYLTNLVRVINADYYFCETIDGRKED